MSLLDLVGESRADLRFGQSLDGELYLTTKQDGQLRKLVGLSADFNDDCTIDASDLQVWQDHLGVKERKLIQPANVF